MDYNCGNCANREVEPGNSITYLNTGLNFITDSIIFPRPTETKSGKQVFESNGREKISVLIAHNVM